MGRVGEFFDEQIKRPRTIGLSASLLALALAACGGGNGRPAGVGATEASGSGNGLPAGTCASWPSVSAFYQNTAPGVDKDKPSTWKLGLVAHFLNAGARDDPGDNSDFAGAQVGETFPDGTTHWGRIIRGPGFVNILFTPGPKLVSYEVRLVGTIGSNQVGTPDVCSETPTFIFKPAATQPLQPVSSIERTVTPLSFANLSN